MPSSFLSGILFTLSFLIAFSVTTLFASPGVSGEPGVPLVGHFRDILTRVLVPATPTGQVKNSQELDAIPASNFQPRITGSCPTGQWAVGANPDNSIKCL